MNTPMRWLVLLVLIGCDPVTPAATGSIRLSSAVQPSAFTTLEIRLYPDTKEAFDLAAPIDSNSVLPLNTETLSVASLSFPFVYELGGSVGQPPGHDWRVLAWVSNQEPSVWPAAGDYFGSIWFPLRACDETCTDVDAVLDTRVP